MPGDQREDAAIVDAHGEIGESQPRQRLRRRQDQLDFDHRRGHAEHVDIALGELAEASLLGPLRAPHRADLDRLERVGQPGVVLGVVAGQRHRQVVAQAKVGQLALPRANRGLQIFTALENLEDQLLVVAALAADEQWQALQRRRLDAPEP